MTPVFVDPDSARVGFAKNILESAGIACCIQNDNTLTLGATLFGSSQQNDPLLCVVDEGRVKEAVVLLREHFGAASNGSEWVCPVCKESNPVSFELCWRCQTAKSE